MVNLQWCDSNQTTSQVSHLLAPNVANTQLSPTNDIATIISDYPEHPLIIANQSLQKLILQKPANRQPTKIQNSTTQHQRENIEKLCNIPQGEDRMANLITTTAQSELALIYH